MLVLMTEADEQLADDVLAAGLPTVVLDTDMSARGLDSVILDNEKGTREAVEHLLRWVEPESLYFVGGPKSNFDTMHRAKGFSEAYAAMGLSLAPEQMCMGDYSIEWGKEWAIRMLRHKKLSGGVLAANDKIACGIMQVAEDAKIDVPDQLRVVGFNDSQLSRMVRPRLSTVALPMAELGATAVRLLVRRIENRNAEVTCTRLATKLIVRESSTAKNFG
jgi:LacI family transcriptional regulator